MLEKEVNLLNDTNTAVNCKLAVISADLPLSPHYVTTAHVT